MTEKCFLAYCCQPNFPSIERKSVPIHANLRAWNTLNPKIKIAKLSGKTFKWRREELCHNSFHTNEKKSSHPTWWKLFFRCFLKGSQLSSLLVLYEKLYYPWKAFLVILSWGTPTMGISSTLYQTQWWKKENILRSFFPWSHAGREQFILPFGVEFSRDGKDWKGNQLTNCRLVI